MLRLALLVPFLASLAVAAEAHAARLKVCTFAFHGPEEVEAFRSSLPPEDFEVLDLTPQTGPTAGGEAGTGYATAPLTMSTDPAGPGWFGGLCRRDLRCDVLVLSGEFAGGFFGRSGQSLRLRELEEASCQARCDGLFRSPQEVFLLACNTLATKDQDMRTPATYLQVLLDHGFDRADAERVVAMRYGPLGPSFREAFRRIFPGTPRLYGFSSVAPTGQYTGPMLDRYFRSVGDYRRHLERGVADGAPNRALAAAFAGTDLTETTGLMPGEPAVADRQAICALYDEQQPIATRLRIVQELMDRPDLLSFIPGIQTFVDRHPSERMQGEDAALFDQVRSNARARERVLDLLRQLDVSALQLELAHFAVHMGWMTREELRALATESARQLLRRPLGSEAVDVMCEIPRHEPVGDRFGSDDLPDHLFVDPEGVRLVSCLAPPGDRVSARLAAALDAPDPAARVWAAHALTRRLPLPDAVLTTLATHLGGPSPEVTRRLEWIFRAQKPISRGVRRTVSQHDPRLAAELWPGDGR